MEVVKSEIGNVTVWPDTDCAVTMPGIGVEPVGRLVVVTVQLLALEFTDTPVGNMTWSVFSVAVVSAVAQIVPPVVLFTASLSSLTSVPRSPAYVF